MLPELGLLAPTIVHAVDVRNGYARKLLFGDTFEAAHVDSVHVGTDAENSDAAVLAEKVLSLPRAEQVLRQIALTREQLEPVRSSDCCPESVAATDGAVAAIAGLGQVEIGLDDDLSAVAARTIAIQHCFTRLDC